MDTVTSFYYIYTVDNLTMNKTKHGMMICADGLQIVWSFDENNYYQKLLEEWVDAGNELIEYQSTSTESSVANE